MAKIASVVGPTIVVDELPVDADDNWIACIDAMTEADSVVVLVLLLLTPVFWQEYNAVYSARPHAANKFNLLSFFMTFKI